MMGMVWRLCLKDDCGTVSSRWNLLGQDLEKKVRMFNFAIILNENE